MKFLIAYLRRVFGVEPSVERITRPMTRIIEKLDAHSDSKRLEAEQHSVAAQIAKARESSANDEAIASKTTANKYRKALGA